MIVVGLTGGIGAGKSAVADLLAEKGAMVIDADAIVRELQQPGQRVLDAMVERFGRGILREDGSLDRAEMARTVFADPAARRDLERIVHPAVAGEVAHRIQALADDAGVVVYEIPLLAEVGRKGFGAVVVVDVDPDVAVRRLVEGRGMAEVDARSRIASQASREERRALADRVVDNSGTRDDLRSQVDELWTWLQSGN